MSVSNIHYAQISTTPVVDPIVSLLASDTDYTQISAILIINSSLAYVFVFAYNAHIELLIHSYYVSLCLPMILITHNYQPFQLVIIPWHFCLCLSSTTHVELSIIHSMCPCVFASNSDYTQILTIPWHLYLCLYLLHMYKNINQSFLSMFIPII